MTPKRIALVRYIRDIPDFPRPGILFRDIRRCWPIRSLSGGDRRAVRALRRGRGGVRGRRRGPRIHLRGRRRARLRAGFVPIRKKGKLPCQTESATYELEYGIDTLEMHRDALRPGARVLMVDDLLATGGTMQAACQLVEKVAVSRRRRLPHRAQSPPRPGTFSRLRRPRRHSLLTHSALRRDTSRSLLSEILDLAACLLALIPNPVVELLK